VGSASERRPGTALASGFSVVTEETRETLQVWRRVGWKQVAGAVLRRAAAGARSVARSLESLPSPGAPWFIGALMSAPPLVVRGGPPLPAPRLIDDPTDPRLRWEAGRGGPLVAVASTGDVAAFERALLPFLEARTEGDPLEAALRAWNLCVAASMVGVRALSEPAAAALARSLVENARWVERRLEDRGVVVGSHLVGELVGLYACGVMLGAAGPEPAAWRARARAGLARASRNQVLPDGAGAEGSTGYGRFVAELWLAALVCARAQREPPPDGVEDAAARMLSHLAATLAPDGRDPGIGDDDGSAVLPGAGDAETLVPLLARWPLETRPAGVRWSDPAAWILGDEGRARWEAAYERPWPARVDAPWFGLWLARRGGHGGDLVTFRAGPHGQHGAGGHAHNDPLAVGVWLDGVPVIADPGTGMYLGRPAWRDRFRGVAAHATLCVDGLEPSPIPATRPFALPDQTHARLLSCDDHAGRWRCVASHEGYARLGVRCRREVRLDRAARRVEIVDTIEGTGTHRLELSFPLGGTAVLDGVRVHVPLPRGRALLEAGPADVDKPLSWRLDPGAVAPRYGEIVAVPVARRVGRVTLPVTLVTSVAGPR
jgi:hypothetical protein